MGRVMPLLTTLAAAVLLAHSHETGDGELVPRESGPRLPGPVDYRQSWRAVESPLPQPDVIPNERGDDTSNQELPKRRRLGRKRKRRPQHDTLDLLPPEHRLYAASSERDAQPSDPPKRRRKRPDSRIPNRWKEDVDQRATWRRTHRRKRPLLEHQEREDLSTVSRDDGYDPAPYGDAVVDKHLLKDDSYVYTTSESDNSDQFNTGAAQTDNRESNIWEDEPRNAAAKTTEEDKWMEETSNAKESAAESANSGEIRKHVAEKDSEESESGTYEGEEQHRTVTANNEKRDKSYRIPYGTARKQESTGSNTASDKSSIIKELLKQSGGLSLSEVLQQRNLSLADLLNGKQNAISALQSDTTVILAEETNKESSVSNQQVDHANADLKPNITSVDTNEDTTTHETNVDTSTPSLQSTHLKRPVVRFTVLTTNKDNNEDKQTTLSPTTIPSNILIPRRHRYRIGKRKHILNKIQNPQIDSTTTAQPKTTLLIFKNNDKVNATESSLRPESNSLGLLDNLVESESKKEIITSEIQPVTSVFQSTSSNLDDTTTHAVTEKTGTQEEIMEQTESKFTINEVDHSKNVPTLKPKSVITNSEIQRSKINKRQRKIKPENKTETLKNSELISIDFDEMVEDKLGIGRNFPNQEYTTKTQTTTTTDLPDLFTDSAELEEEKIIPKKAMNEKVTIKNIDVRIPKYTAIRQRISTTMRNIIPSVTTEDSAKEEILEIFKDMNGAARLAKVLSERNMTIKELVEHRERGSSQIHLADIFHNASREPNPPEPFLSKSLIEPISKETYPLRALLEANHHDPHLKAAHTQYAAQYTNVPLIVDYGRNIHENGENLGIVSLFKEFTKAHADSVGSVAKTDSEGAAYFTSVVNVSATADNNRSGKSLKIEKATPTRSTTPIQVEPNEISSMLPEEEKQFNEVASTFLKLPVKPSERDSDGDGVIVLADLQQNTDRPDHTSLAVNEKLKTHQRGTPTERDGFLARLPSGTRSATTVSAIVAGVITSLLLLTYCGYKWRERRMTELASESGRGEKIPSPVFEHRKSQRNCSNRSISPMLASSTGFSLSTLDSQHGKESPEYMWDTLRKPFQ